MGLEQEQGYLRTDIWYYNYTKSEFAELIQRYPYIPFYVDDGSSFNKYYRWNTKKNRLEFIDSYNLFVNNWDEGTIKIKSFIANKKHLNFIIFRVSLLSYFNQNRDDLEIIINNKHQELIPRDINLLFKNKNFVSNYN